MLRHRCRNSRFFPDIKKKSMAGIQALNSYSSESLEYSVGKFLSLGKPQNYGSAQGALNFTRNSKVLRNVSLSCFT